MSEDKLQVRFWQAQKADLPASSTPGQLYVATDTGETYFDKPAGDRLQIGNVPSDYAENDESSPAYIHNRPFYTTETAMPYTKLDMSLIKAGSGQAVAVQSPALGLVPLTIYTISFTIEEQTISSGFRCMSSDDLIQLSAFTLYSDDEFENQPESDVPLVTLNLNLVDTDNYDQLGPIDDSNEYIYVVDTVDTDANTFTLKNNATNKAVPATFTLANLALDSTTTVTAGLQMLLMRTWENIDSDGYTEVHFLPVSAYIETNEILQIVDKFDVVSGEASDTQFSWAIDDGFVDEGILIAIQGISSTITEITKIPSEYLPETSKIVNIKAESGIFPIQPTRTDTTDIASGYVTYDAEPGQYYYPVNRDSSAGTFQLSLTRNGTPVMSDTASIFHLPSLETGSGTLSEYDRLQFISVDGVNEMMRIGKGGAARYIPSQPIAEHILQGWATIHITLSGNQYFADLSEYTTSGRLELLSMNYYIRSTKYDYIGDQNTIFRSASQSNSIAIRLSNTSSPSSIEYMRSGYTTATIELNISDNIISYDASTLTYPLLVKPNTNRPDEGICFGKGVLVFDSELDARNWAEALWLSETPYNTQITIRSSVI